MFGDLNIVLVILICTVIGFILILGIWGAFMQWSVFFRYQANNRRQIPGKTAKEIAEEMLQKLGYGDVQVRRTSYFWLFFFYKWGNRYSPRRNAIFLYRNILNKSTVTAIAIATQKVGLVMQHRAGEKKMKFRAKWEVWTRLAPNMFVPIITLGAIIDLIINGGAVGAFGIVTLVFVGIAILYTLIAFYCLYLIIPTERRAGQLAFETIAKYNLIPAEHFDRVQGLYRVQVNVYIADFILAILNLVLDILYIVAKVASNR